MLTYCFKWFLIISNNNNIYLVQYPMYIRTRVQWTYNDINNNHSRYTLQKQKYHKNNIQIIRINLQSTSDIYCLVWVEFSRLFLLDFKNIVNVTAWLVCHNSAIKYVKVWPITSSFHPGNRTHWLVVGSLIIILALLAKHKNAGPKTISLMFIKA